MYTKFCHIYTDGSKVDEKASSAVYSPYGKTSFRLPDNSSIFTAEIRAIIKALEYVKNSGLSQFVIFSDSKSVLETISSQESNNPLLNHLFQMIYSIQNPETESPEPPNPIPPKIRKIIHFCWVPSHVGIRGNEMADQLAKEGLNKDPSLYYKMPYTDLLPNVKSHVKVLWQERWDNQNDNKLNAISPIIKPFKYNNLSRKEEVIMHRIRIGHTRLTHSYLMEGKPLPTCHFCNNARLSIKHIMLEWHRFMYPRRRHFIVRSMKDLFETVPVRTIIAFVKDIGIFDNL